MVPLTAASPSVPVAGVFTMSSPDRARRTLEICGAGRRLRSASDRDGRWARDQCGSTLLDRSQDGADVLLSVGKISPSGLHPECVDLYLIRTDGTGATRLTQHGPGQYVTAAAFSPDGTQVVYSTWTGISTVDLATGTNKIATTCTTGNDYTGWVAWAPSGDQIAATCQGLVLLDPIGSNGTSHPDGNRLRGGPGLVWRRTFDRSSHERPGRPGARRHRRPRHGLDRLPGRRSTTTGSS